MNQKCPQQYIATETLTPPLHTPQAHAKVVSSLTVFTMIQFERTDPDHKVRIAKDTKV